MGQAEAPLAVLGATGYTGRLVCECAREVGLPLRLVGRRLEALEEVAADGEEVRVADARDRRALEEAFAGAFAVASCAGPFLDLGPAAPSAAVAAGAHYLDTSGEQAWTRRLYEELDEPARAQGVAVLPCFGFDYVPGDLAARLAAEGLEPLDEVVVAYGVSGAASSAGTRRTIARVMTQPVVAFEDGRLVPSRFGATARELRFPFGVRAVVEWSGAEPLTVPRHTQVRTVRSYVRAPRAAARLARLAPVVAPLLRASAHVGSDPEPAKRARTRFAVVAEARGPAGARRVTLTGRDPYLLTARLQVHGADLLRSGEARGAGALAPAQAFDARELLSRLGDLVEAPVVEAI